MSGGAAGAPPERRRRSSRTSSTELDGPSTPASALPAGVSATSLKRVLVLQQEGKLQQADRLLEATLRPLQPASARPLGAVGALLYLWRARSRRSIGKTIEAKDDLTTAITHVGAESREPPPPEKQAALAEADAKATAASTRAAVEALSKLRRDAELARSNAEVAAFAASRSAEKAAELTGPTGGVALSEAAQEAVAAAVEAEATAAEAAARAAYYNTPEALNTSAVASAAAAVITPRPAWWACGLLLEEGLELEEEANERKEALRRYVAASGWQRGHVIAASNQARLLEEEENDLIAAASAYLRIVEATASARRVAASATEALLAEDDDEDDVVALRRAAHCADAIRDELEAMRVIMRSGFAQRPADAGPPSEVPMAQQQGKVRRTRRREFRPPHSLNTTAHPLSTNYSRPD